MWMVTTISSKFLALSYFFDMAPRLFQKVESLTFEKMYGGICHLKWYRWTNFMDLAHGLIASIERPLWQPLCFHSATTTSLEPPWRWFCLHSASFARPVFPLHQFWWLKEGTGVVLQQLHRNRAFWVWATTERPGQFSGRSKVARRSQSCAKGAWELVVHLFEASVIWKIRFHSYRPK